MSFVEERLVSALSTTVSAGAELLIVAVIAVTSLVLIDRIVNGKKKR